MVTTAQGPWHPLEVLCKQQNKKATDDLLLPEKLLMSNPCFHPWIIAGAFTTGTELSEKQWPLHLGATILFGNNAGSIYRPVATDGRVSSAPLL
jgi:hypothetical protein